MKITLKVIADETGVSQMTVSRILRGKADGQVSNPVRRKVTQALEKYSYDFQKPARISARRRDLREKKITFIIPRPDYLESPPTDNNIILFRKLEQYAAANGIRLPVISASRDNDPTIPDWAELEKLQEGDPVIFQTTYLLTAAIALQRKGCRVGMIVRDLFWRNFYAPQLKNMAVFVIKTGEGAAEAVRALLDSGCGRIACSVYERHMLEPNHPVLSGYDYALRLRGSRYRHVIPIPNRNENYPLGELFREAYRRNPFDGLYLRTNARAFDNDFGDIHDYLGLPKKVRIIASELKENFRNGGFFAVLRFPYDEIIREAARTLLSETFVCSEQFFNCKLEIFKDNKKTNKTIKSTMEAGT